MIGVIADDLSGAAEIGGAGLRHGLSAEIVRGIGLPGGWSFQLPGKTEGRGSVSSVRLADVICVDTDSRSCTAVEAGRRAAAAARALAAAGASWVYKKVDSVLRGQVTAEIEAILLELQLKRALVLPANPSRGRIIRDGRYFVNGKPIHRTEFVRDPEYPRKSAKVCDLIPAPAIFALTVCRAGESLPRTGIIVGEAVDGKDLEQWAQLRRRPMLHAGGVDFFSALLADAGHRPSPPKSAGGAIVGRELFVCGTTSKSGRDFLRLARAARTPVFSLPSELVSGGNFTGAAKEMLARRAISSFGLHSRVILSVGLPIVREHAVARLLSFQLVQLAEKVLRQTQVDRVYAEGGATAAALVQRMNWTRLRVLEEVASGVATLGVNENSAMRLTMKPGSYVWPEEIRRSPGLRFTEPPRKVRLELGSGIVLRVVRLFEPTKRPFEEAVRRFFVAKNLAVANHAIGDHHEHEHEVQQPDPADERMTQPGEDGQYLSQESATHENEKDAVDNNETKGQHRGK